MCSIHFIDWDIPAKSQQQARPTKGVRDYPKGTMLKIEDNWLKTDDLIIYDFKNIEVSDDVKMLNGLQQ